MDKIDYINNIIGSKIKMEPKEELKLIFLKFEKLALKSYQGYIEEKQTLESKKVSKFVSALCNMIDKGHEAQACKYFDKILKKAFL